MTSLPHVLQMLSMLPLASAPVASRSDTTDICLGPATVETSVGNNAEAVNAVRETFAGYLTGPSLGVVPLTARLESQVREEAKAKGCTYLLLSTVKHTRKTSGGGGLLRRMAGGAVQQGAWHAGVAAGGTMAGVAASAAAGAAGVAAYDYAATIKTKDELTLSYRLESATGAGLVEKTEKRKAESDGEDLLSPLVQHAAEAVAAAVARQPR